jgi:8-oxo-dGTP pyrophosphatase MutT (NUDIX family)
MARAPSPSGRPTCPECATPLPRRRLCCPSCNTQLIDRARLVALEGLAREIALRYRQQPWFASSTVLPYVQRSPERGFLERFSTELEAGLRELLEEVGADLGAHVAQLLLEHLIDGPIRTESRALSAFYRRRLPELLSD